MTLRATRATDRLFLFRQVDHAEAAFPDYLEQFVRADFFPNDIARFRNFARVEINRIDIGIPLIAHNHPPIEDQGNLTHDLI